MAAMTGVARNPRKRGSTAWRRAAEFGRDSSGLFLEIFALWLPVGFAVVWIATDLLFLNAQRERMEAAADSAALAGARQMSLSNVSVATIQQVATGTVKANLPANPSPSGNDQISAVVDSVNATVTVTRSFSSLLGSLYTPASTLTVNATALYKSSPICVLTLDPSGQAFDAKSSSDMTATGCAILSNSTAANGLTATTSGTVAALKACSAGGYSGSAFTPTPIIDCPAVNDPLAVRAPPSNVGNGCDYINFSFTDSAVPLNPGVYCGGITVKHGPATFNAGDYILRGGGLTINAGGSVIGADVGFYLTGGAVLNAKPNSALSLSAPSSASDPMVGLVFWEDPANMPLGQAATHEINSDNGQNLHGTVYFPQGTLYIGGHANVGSASAYTIIVAHDLVTDQQANVVLNTNYMGSNIPVPPGVGNTLGSLTLSR